MEINAFLNNKKATKGKNNINNISNKLNFNTSVNQSDNLRACGINTSINSKNCFEHFENKNNFIDYHNKNNMNKK